MIVWIPITPFWEAVSVRRGTPAPLVGMNPCRTLDHSYDQIDPIPKFIVRAHWVVFIPYQYLSWRCTTLMLARCMEDHCAEDGRQNLRAWFCHVCSLALHPCNFDSNLHGKVLVWSHNDYSSQPSQGWRQPFLGSNISLTIFPWSVPMQQ